MATYTIETDEFTRNTTLTVSGRTYKKVMILEGANISLEKETNEILDEPDGEGFRLVKRAPTGHVEFKLTGNMVLS